MVAAAPRGENLAELFASATSTTGPPSGLDDLVGALLASRPSWMADGLCAEYAGRVNFFPSQGDDVTAAKAVCAWCLALPECRAWTAEQGAELHGVWAGTTWRQRTRWDRTGLEPPLPERGTEPLGDAIEAAQRPSRPKLERTCRTCRAELPATSGRGSARNYCGKPCRPKKARRARQRPAAVPDRPEQITSSGRHTAA